MFSNNAVRPALESEEKPRMASAHTMRAMRKAVGGDGGDEDISQRAETIQASRLALASAWNFSNYRDPKILGVFVCGVIFQLMLLVYVVLASDPRQWDCSRYPCESDVATFYNHPVQSNPDEPRCWSTPQPKLCSACDNCAFCSEENWMASCVRKESLFHQFDRLGGQYIYIEVGGVLILVTVLAMVLTLKRPGLVVPVAHYGTAFFLWVGFLAACVSTSWWALFWFFLAFMHLIYLMIIRTKFPDAVMMLTAAAGLVRKYPNLKKVALGTAVFQAGWFMMWGFIFVSVNGRLSGFVDFLQVLMLFWIFMVAKYIAACTTMGTISHWYFAKSLPAPTATAFKRSATTSLGSICVGCFFVSMSKFLKVTTGWMRFSRSGTLQILGAISKVVEVVLGQFNAYGFVQVAVYGKDFFESCRSAFELLAESGLRLIMVDDIIAGAVTAGSVGMGFMGVAISYILFKIDLHGSSPSSVSTEATTEELVVVLFVPAFILGLIMGLVGLELVESVIITVYTCFAEEPHMLEKADEELYADLVDLWYGANDEDTESETSSDEGEGAGGDSDQSISDFTDSDDEEAGRRRDSKGSRDVSAKRFKTVAPGSTRSMASAGSAAETLAAPPPSSKSHASNKSLLSNKA